MLHAERLHVPLNKKMVADVCQISMVTISKCYKMLIIQQALQRYHSRRCIVSYAHTRFC